MIFIDNWPTSPFFSEFLRGVLTSHIYWISLNNSLTQKIQDAFTRQQISSLRAFYQAHSFSFSYEYLRQIMAGAKIPQTLVLQELAQALGVDIQELKRLAADSILSRKIEHLYKLPSRFVRGRLSEKVEKYKKEKITEEKFLKLYQQLGQKEKIQVLNYIRFLRQQCRKKPK